MKVRCKYCGSDKLIKNGHSGGKQMWRCKDCGRCFVEGSTTVTKGRRVTEKDVYMIIDLNKAGFNDSEVAGILGLSPTTVSRYRRMVGLPKVGYTCCSMINKVKKEELLKKIEMCGKATIEFLDRYFEGDSSYGGE